VKLSTLQFQNEKLLVEIEVLMTKVEDDKARIDELRAEKGTLEMMRNEMRVTMKGFEADKKVQSEGLRKVVIDNDS
jgi:predicted nuclease with TOPRIM domain